MDRRDFIKATTLSLATLSGCYLQDDALYAKQNRPNVIFILADDLGYGDLGCYGQKVIKTPNIDKLAAEGIKFTQHYAGSTVCAPSRCCLMTGLHTGNCRVNSNATGLMLLEEDTTVAQIFKNVGYKTAIIGKWGLGETGSGLPQNNGFDYFYGYLNQVQAHNYYPEYLWENDKKIPLGNVVKRPKNTYEEAKKYGGEAIIKKQYSHDLFTQKSIDFIESNRDNPFFLYLAYTLPHANNEAPLVSGNHGMEIPDVGIYADKNWPSAQKAHAAMITKLDSDVNRLMTVLKKNNIYKNTLVIFTSDNGPHNEAGACAEFFRSSGALRGSKRDLYEGGIRVPFIAHWQGTIKAGSKSDHISAFWDFMPTVADLLSSNLPCKTDGISYLPSLLGKDEQVQHKCLYWQFRDKRALRTNNWKVVINNPLQAAELYDLDNDISERNDIALQNPLVVRKALKIIGELKQPHISQVEV